ncbi:uncharacterized protein GGS22DRAFT_179942 [Annulohypoxylon maeteangense]|uniref:uncharacterized protein n=1 Tax=Annulohypoxylon maeteangense TaxID=1927788 RepID=UPI002008D5FC|nr:uncharacterized protein GGS22DRAFT_179942 [Annulohypoxylon maeteangense]KAI0884572.1 hypothetical protein GGS22DRAFT_179942 [Annulohypoxylon maeteangense]
MEEHVEARSLASLNYLAANPPQYPKKPNEEKQDPIILYISRVPGTRDIILSTLKPQVKSVTAEDVASSLYYVHLNVPEDDVLIPPGQTKPPSPRTSGESSRSGNQIHRKPVPGTSSLASSRIDENAPPPSINENPGNTGQAPLPLRKPVPQPAPAPLSERPPASQFVSPPNLPPRKLVGPRSIGSESPERNLPLPPIYDQPPEYPMRPSMDVPSLPPRPSELEDPFTGYGRSPSPKSPTKRPFTPFSLTLIRRDPSSGQQWNVGKVASFQLENPELINDEKHRQPSPSIMIHLETSGYAKFRGMPTHQTPADLREIRASLDLRRPGSASSSAKFPQIPDLNPPVPVTASNAFERQVVMAYSKSFGAAIREKFHHRSTSEEERSPPPIFTTRPSRHGSVGSIGSYGGDFDGGEAPVITQPAPGLKPRGYMFKSPWGGRCEFVTGNAGRSLKCRHVLPNYTGAVFNPLVDGQEAGHHGHKPKGQPISELRFNLPSSELFTEKRSTEGGARTRDQLQTQFNKVLQKAHGHDYYDDDDDDWHLDLSLGREKAGGGNRGKRAKMGKLIVFDDGLKMLDLVVAANVGVWWTAWERTYDVDRDLVSEIR